MGENCQFHSQTDYYQMLRPVDFHCEENQGSQLEPPPAHSTGFMTRGSLQHHCCMVDAWCIIPKKCACLHVYMHVYDDVNCAQLQCNKIMFPDALEWRTLDGKDNCGKNCFLLKDSQKCCLHRNGWSRTHTPLWKHLTGSSIMLPPLLEQVYPHHHTPNFACLGGSECYLFPLPHPKTFKIGLCSVRDYSNAFITGYQEFYDSYMFLFYILITLNNLE